MNTKYFNSRTYKKRYVRDKLCLQVVVVLCNVYVCTVLHSHITYVHTVDWVSVEIVADPALGHLNSENDFSLSLFAPENLIL